MEKVDLDEEFDKWKNKNEMLLQSLFCHTKEKEFEGFVEESWREYQDVNGLIDESNEIKE